MSITLLELSIFYSALWSSFRLFIQKCHRYRFTTSLILCIAFAGSVAFSMLLLNFYIENIILCRLICASSLNRSEENLQRIFSSWNRSKKSLIIVLSQVIFSYLLPCLTGYEINFQKYTHAQIDLLEAPYDMTSIMHLPRNAFSKNGLNTLEARAGSHVVLGESSDLSEIDKAQLNLLYSCTGYPSMYGGTATSSLFSVKRWLQFSVFFLNVIQPTSHLIVFNKIWKGKRFKKIHISRRIYGFMLLIPLSTGCFKAFGMESFHIPDSQITASSYKQYYEPHQGRLHLTASATGNGAWCAGQSNQQGEWLQVTSYNKLCCYGSKKINRLITRSK